MVKPMTDSTRLTIGVQDGAVQFIVEQASVDDLIQLLGYYTKFVVMKAVKCGADAEDIKQYAIETVLFSVASLKDIGTIQTEQIH